MMRTSLQSPATTNLQVTSATPSSNQVIQTLVQPQSQQSIQMLTASQFRNLILMTIMSAISFSPLRLWQHIVYQAAEVLLRTYKTRVTALIQTIMLVQTQTPLTTLIKTMMQLS